MMHSTLTVINHFSKGKYKNIRHFWGYITGLRGNDDGSDDFKEAFTVLIRGNNVPYGLSKHWCYIHEWDKHTSITRLTKAYAVVSSHTITHAVWAFKSLSKYYNDIKKVDISKVCDDIAWDLETRNAEQSYEDILKFIQLTR